MAILTNEAPISNSFGTLDDLTNDIVMRDVDQTDAARINSEDNPSFPTTNFYELEQRVFQDNWSIPYRKDESLGKCLYACTKMAHEGILAEESESNKDIRKFLDSVMPEAFKKLLSSNATAKWNRQVLELILSDLTFYGANYPTHKKSLKNF